MSIYTCWHTHSHTWVAGGPVDLIPCLCCMCLVSSSTPFSPSRCCCSAPSGSRKRHKGCLCCEPSAPLPRVLSSGCQWDTWPDLSTCTDVEELRHCLDFPFLSVAFSAACVHCKFFFTMNKKKQTEKTPKRLKDYFLCPSFSWFSLFPETVATHC